MSDSQEPRFESVVPEGAIGSIVGAGVGAAVGAGAGAGLTPGAGLEPGAYPDGLGDGDERADDRSANGEGESASDSRPRRRIQTSGRPVSAFGASSAPRNEAVGARADNVPQSGPKPVPVSPELPQFLASLRIASLLGELRSEQLPNFPELGSEPSPALRMDFLNAYYAAGSDAVVSLRRRATDRWFIYDTRQNLVASQLVQRLTFILPELAGTHLERVGGRFGTLLLRSGEHVCALDDEQPSTGGGAEITLTELVRGMNMLLERRGERARLVGLLGDGLRESYLGIGSLALALPLCAADLLAADDVASLIHLTGW